MTLGVRVSRLERFLATRAAGIVKTEFGEVQVKIKQIGERRIVSPEYDDAARLARAAGQPLAEIYRAVQRAEPPRP